MLKNLKNILLLCCAALFFQQLPGSENLIPEWDDLNTEKLKNWSFSAWSRYSIPKKTVSGKRRITIKNGKKYLSLTTGSLTAKGRISTGNFINIASRRINISPSPFPRRCRFSFSVSGGPETALLSAVLSGHAMASKRIFINTTPEAKQYFIERLLPPGRKNLFLTFQLSGAGEAVISQCRLEMRPVPDVPATEYYPAVRDGIFHISASDPELLRFKLAAGAKAIPGAIFRLTLPRGFKVINSSYSTGFTEIKLLPGLAAEYTFSISGKAKDPAVIQLLTETVMPAAPGLHSCSYTLEHEGKIIQNGKFFIKIIDYPKIFPTRRFSILRSGSLPVNPREANLAYSNGILRSGANVLVGNSTFADGTLLKGSPWMKHFAQLTLNRPQKTDGCYYTMLRNESFWENIYLPGLQRRIKRHNGRVFSGLIADSILDQGIAINCLCALCRSEFADFSPKLPEQRIMTASARLLEYLYHQELAKFRNARKIALRNSALLHLPGGKLQFHRNTGIFHSLPVLNVTSPDACAAMRNVILDFNFAMPENAGNREAAEFLLAREKIAVIRKNNRRLPVIASFRADDAGEDAGFRMLNFCFSGFSGVYPSGTISADARFKASVARSSGIIKEYERFFFSGKNVTAQWSIAGDAPALTLPLLAWNSGNPVPVPEKFNAVQLRAWQYGKEHLTAIGNFSREHRSVTLHFKNAAKYKTIEFNGSGIDPNEMSSGIPVEIPPLNWTILKFTLR